MAGRGVVCAKCSQKIGRYDDVIDCTAVCKSAYHIACVEISVDQFQAMNTSKTIKDWKCFNCVNINTVKDTLSDNKTVHDGLHTTGIDAKLSLICKQLEILPILNENVKTLSDKVSDITDQLKKLQSDMQNVSDQANTNSDTIATLQIENEQKTLEINNLINKFNRMDQYSRNKNIEIHGLKEENEENLHLKVEAIAKILRIPNFIVNEIDAIHRLPAKNRNLPRPIIVQFNRRPTRDLFLTNKRRVVITNNDIKPNSGDNQVFINENLNPMNKELFWKARNAKKELNFKHLWTYKGTIYMKKNDESQAVKISTEADIPLR